MPAKPAPTVSFSAALVDWFSANQRDLPFRRTRDPYAIWVAETMLQQTQVTTVLPYFERFLRRFPDVQALAAAPLEEVLRLWSGLGYYRRARHLHAAAREIIQSHGGQIPRDLSALLALPGIGRYTAGAILSMAWNQHQPVLDGNVIRVLCRVFEVRGDPKKGPTRRHLWALASELIPPGRAGCFNQAMMELGALLCLPRNPACQACPVCHLCRAYLNGSIARFPFSSRRPKTEKREVATAVILNRKRVLIARKPEGQQLGGLWEFPTVERRGKLPAKSILRHAVKRQFGLEIQVGSLLATFQHSILNARITVQAYHCAARSSVPRLVGLLEGYDRVVWAALADLEKFGLPSASRRIAAALRKSPIDSGKKRLSLFNKKKA